MVVLNIYTLEDTEEKDLLVSLKEGEHEIGRGGILQCNDKRISRKHAILQVTKEFVTIKSVHINPCFFKGTDDSSVSIITQNTSLVLNDGDNFALLADKFWFKVRIVRDEPDQVTNGNVEKSNEILYNGNESVNGSPSKSDTTNLNTTLTNGSSSKRCLNEESLTESCKRQKADHQEHIGEMCDKGNTSGEKTPSRSSSPGLDVLLDTSPNVITNEENVDSTGLINSLENIVREDFGTTNGNMANKDVEGSGDNPEKTNTTESTNLNGEVQVKQEKPDENIKVKQEPEDNLENQQNKDINEANNAAEVIPPNKIKNEVKEENVGSSRDNEGNKDNASKDETDKASSSTNNQNKKTRRERCWFGATCYRKNPIHRADFSHPGDNDYNSDPDDDRPACPYGAACYRKNIEHRRQYKHSQPPAPKPNVDVNKPKKKRRSPKKKPRDDNGDSADDQNDSNDNDSDDGDDTKKKRKAARDKKYYDSPEDDYDYEDPFIDDGSSSEFELSSDDDDSTDWDDSQKVDEESQETRRLLKEAKRFTKKGKGKKKD